MDAQALPVVADSIPFIPSWLPPAHSPETQDASSDLNGSWAHQQSTRPVPVPVEPSVHPEAFHASPSQPSPSQGHPSSARSQSLASQGGPIRRKPLPESAAQSPTIARYSSPQLRPHQIPDFPLPPSFSSLQPAALRKPNGPPSERSSSLDDSPSEYDFLQENIAVAITPITPATSILTGATSVSLASVRVISTSQDSAQPDSPGDWHPNALGSRSSIPAATETHFQAPHAPSSGQTASDDAIIEEAPSLALEGLINDSSSDTSDPPDRHVSILDPEPVTLQKALPRKLSLGQATATDSRAHPSPSSSFSFNRGDVNRPLPRSPSSRSKISAIFGWVASPASSDFSDKALSPFTSPFSFTKSRKSKEASDASSSSTKSLSRSLDESPLAYCETHLQTPPIDQKASAEVTEMEDELKAISAELAASIRREMDLEELAERLQDQVNSGSTLNSGKRTSDYYSDSGYSSAKFSDYDQAKEEMAQVQRKAEQEKAQLRLDFTNKLQDERTRRRQLDQQILDLSKKASAIDLAQLRSQDASGRVKELEKTCQELRRSLSDERQVRNNFEGLLATLKGELQVAANERDNLRDEIVPQLQARLEGLEVEAVEYSKLAYDTIKMQQELQSLQSENIELRQTDSRMSPALSKSASVAGGMGQKIRSISVTRSNTTVKNNEPREALAERLKDVEAQRDALHNALRNLLERQEFQNRENEKRIKGLEGDRDRLLSSSPKKSSYEREVSKLRDEINILRRRAEDAVDQKWEVEKGLAGLKMDLDRAEAEIGSLRSLLAEKDILIPATLPRGSTGSEKAVEPVSSATLEMAYRDLQGAYADALERMKAAENSAERGDERTTLVLQRLQQSLESALSERDLARTKAEAQGAHIASLEASEKSHLAAECELADQLSESVRKVEDLASQVRTQLDMNAGLRTRLAETVFRGEANQRASIQRISDMQTRLRRLEESLVAAQTAAEERVSRHEEEVATLKEAHSAQLQRLSSIGPILGGQRSPRQGAKTPGLLRSPLLSARPGSCSSAMAGGMLKSPRSPIFGSRLSVSSRPRTRRSSSTPLDGGLRGSSAGSMAAHVEALRWRVLELEGALTTADLEMQEVVGRMNAAQIEVLQLQEEREEAVRQTRRLQQQLDDERLTAFQGRFRTLTTNVVAAPAPQW